MRYRMPLEKRRHVAARRRERYHSDEAYRLTRINDRRLRAGLPAIQSLEEMGQPGRRDALRDDLGRFV